MVPGAAYSLRSVLAHQEHLRVPSIPTTTLVPEVPTQVFGCLSDTTRPRLLRFRNPDERDDRHLPSLTSCEGLEESWNELPGEIANPQGDSE